MSKLSAIVCRNLKLSTGLLTAISSILFWCTPASAGTTIAQTTCPVLIAQSGEYTLATDVGPCLPGIDGIDIEASSVTLHLNGHNIIGSLDSTVCNTSHGILIGLPAPAPILSQVKILGAGTISNFHEGLHAESSAGSFAKFVTVTGSCSNEFTFGFVIAGPGGQWKLQENVVREPGASSQGIVIEHADDNDLVRNNVNDSIQFLDSNNNTVVNNVANDSPQGGIVIGTVLPSNNNEIHANTTYNNSFGNGITIESGSTGNDSTGNTAFGNVLFDLFDGNPNCDSNKWQGNHFGTANQPCLQ